MYNSDCFEQFLGFGNAGESLTFNYLTLSAFKVDPAPLARLGLLRERTIGSRIECAGCGVFAPISPRMEEDGITLYADCPECGRYRLSRYSCPERHAVPGLAIFLRSPKCFRELMPGFS